VTVIYLHLEALRRPSPPACHAVWKIDAGIRVAAGQDLKLQLKVLEFMVVHWPKVVKMRLWPVDDDLARLHGEGAGAASLARQLSSDFPSNSRLQPAAGCLAVRMFVPLRGDQPQSKRTCSPTRSLE